jgi:hypothetical protein
MQFASHVFLQALTFASSPGGGFQTVANVTLHCSTQVGIQQLTCQAQNFTHM